MFSFCSHWVNPPPEVHRCQKSPWKNFEAAKALAHEMQVALGPGPFVVEKSLALAMLLAAQLRANTPDLAASKDALSAFEQQRRNILTTCGRSVALRPAADALHGRSYSEQTARAAAPC